MFTLLRQLFHRPTFGENYVPQAGRYYAFRYNEKYYKIFKVLVVDKIDNDIFGVHICQYGRLFRFRPRFINPDKPEKLMVHFKPQSDETTLGAMLRNLKSDEMTISHLPYTYGAWLDMFPRFICNGNVSERELDGYYHWKEARGGYWD